MKLDYLFEPGFVVPNESDTTYQTFMEENVVIYSAMIYVTTGHEAQTMINTAEFKNNGNGSDKHLMEWYDAEGIEESLAAATLAKFLDIKLTKIHKGACNTFIASFVSHLSTLKEEEVPLHDQLARDLFLLKIKHEDYRLVKNALRGEKASLTECYSRIKSLSVNVEKGQEMTRRQIRLQKQKENGTNQGSSAGLFFKGQPVNENGFFVNDNDYKALSDNDR